MDSISGRKLADIISSLNEGVDASAPAAGCSLTSPASNRSCGTARAAGAGVLPGHEVVGALQDASGVTLRVRDVDGGRARAARPVPDRRRRRH